MSISLILEGVADDRGSSSALHPIILGESLSKSSSATAEQDHVSTTRITCMEEQLDHYDARINEILLNRYRVRRKIGGGVYSTTWLVEDITKA